MSVPRRALGAEAEFTSAKAVNRGTKCSSDENVEGGGCPSKLKNRIQSLCAFLQINNFFVYANFLNIDTNFFGG